MRSPGCASCTCGSMHRSSVCHSSEAPCQSTWCVICGPLRQVVLQSAVTRFSAVPSRLGKASHTVSRLCSHPVQPPRGIPRWRAGYGWLPLLPLTHVGVRGCHATWGPLREMLVHHRQPAVCPASTLAVLLTISLLGSYTLAASPIISLPFLQPCCLARKPAACLIHSRCLAYNLAALRAVSHCLAAAHPTYLEVKHVGRRGVVAERAQPRHPNLQRRAVEQRLDGLSQASQHLGGRKCMSVRGRIAELRAVEHP